MFVFFELMQTETTIVLKGSPHEHVDSQICHYRWTCCKGSVKDDMPWRAVATQKVLGEIFPAPEHHL
jgi:hypothetical protein